MLIVLEMKLFPMTIDPVAMVCRLELTSAVHRACSHPKLSFLVRLPYTDKMPSDEGRQYL